MFLLFLSFLACADGRSGPSPSSTKAAEGIAVDVPVDTLEGEVLARPDTMGAATDLLLVQGLLVANDAFGPPFFHIFSPATGKRLLAAGEGGSGPGEFSSLKYMDVLPGTDRVVSLSDLTQGRITIVEFPPASEMGPDLSAEDLVRETIPLHSTAPIYPVWLDDTTMVATGVFPEGRLGVLDGEGGLRDQVGALPAYDDTVPPRVLQQAYQSTLVKHPGRDLLALATRYGSSVQVLDPGGELVASAATPHSFEPEFHVADRRGNAVMSLEDDTRVGYVDVAATADRIYALFSGRLQREAGRDAGLGDRVHVFTWEGELTRVLAADAGLTAIAVAGDSVVYGSSVHPVPAIRRYRLAGSAR